MSSQEFYTAEEVMKILGKPRSTFFKDVADGVIPSVIEPGKKRGRKFPREAIDAYATIQKKRQKKTAHFTFSRATNSDIWEAVQNSKRVYGDDYIPYQKCLEWRFINDQMTMAMKDSGVFVGTSSIMPLDEKIILKLIPDEIREVDLPIEAIKKWEEPAICAYIVSTAIVHTGDKNRDTLRGRYLLKHTIEWAIRLYHQYDVKKFYAIGGTPEGQNILEELGFKQIANLYNGERKGYVLDSIKKATKLLKAFLAEDDELADSTNAIQETTSESAI